jgi:hypothetical protein
MHPKATEILDKLLNQWDKILSGGASSRDKHCLWQVPPPMMQMSSPLIKTESNPVGSMVTNRNDTGVINHFPQA